MGSKKIEDLCVNTIRMLSADMVEKANSGHPGMPLGVAPMAYVLWTKFLKHNPKNPSWPDRDRFVLSAGHGSALLYSLLHLSGYYMPMREIQNFRQWESKTPGHPEYDLACGIEATTGPLGQGFAMGVGMAIAERFLASRYNRDGMNVVDHHTYAIVSDGDLMEGIASEAASIAGHLKLGKIIYLYDDNHISIEGDTNITFTEDVLKRFESYGWHIQKVSDGNDLHAIEKAIKKAKDEISKPSIIAVRTHIGYGTPKQDDAGVHGSPLGEAALLATKEKIGWPKDQPFYVPDEVKEHFASCVEQGQKFATEWQDVFDKYAEKYPDDGKRFGQETAHAFCNGWEEYIPSFDASKDVATRSASGRVINGLAKMVPNLIGGSADLAPSNNTHIDEGGDVGPELNSSRNIHFGVREHAMGAIVNGMALHGGTIPYGATFLVFSDYMRPAVRLSALMNVHSIFIFTHDSIGLGEDGPTHQPIEQLMSLRAIPNMTVFRPADANETVEVWKLAMQRKGPSSLIFTRQKLPILDPNEYPLRGGVKNGAYVLTQCVEDKDPDVILIATGSEVHLALDALKRLSEQGVNARVVSMPSWEVFDEQSEDYKNKVLPKSVKRRLAIEAGVTLGWHRYVGVEGKVIGIDKFGASAPHKAVMEKYGFSVDNVVDQTLKLCGK